MSTKKTFIGRRNLSAGLILSVFAAGGCNSAAHSLNGAANNSNAVVNSSNQTKEKMIVIKQGTVGKVGEFSVGVKNVSAGVVDLSVWNDALPQEKRNDYNIKFSAKTGEIVPIGNKLYKLGKIGDGAVEIETEPLAESSSLDKNALAIPSGGSLELHGAVVEVVSIASENGKISATVETYSNDYPKADSAAKDKITKTKAAAGDALDVGGIKHKVAGVSEAKNGVPGIFAIAIAPIGTPSS